MVDMPSSVGSPQPVGGINSNTPVGGNNAPSTPAGHPSSSPEEFEKYLNQHGIAWSGQSTSSATYDPASDISKNSVYLPPGQFTPT